MLGVYVVYCMVVSILVLCADCSIGCASGRFVHESNNANVTYRENTSVAASLYDRGLSGDLIVIGAYGNNINKIWSIHASTKIILSFSKFDLEDGWDYVIVYFCDVVTSNVGDCTKISENTGHKIPKQHETNMGTVLIQLFSDESESNTGFIAHWTLEFTDDNCNGCSIDAYKSTAGDGPCQDCPPNSFGPEASNNKSYCTCNSGFTGPDGDDCIKCDVGFYKTKVGSSQFLQRDSIRQHDCKCNSGSTGNDRGPCTECAYGKYKVESGSNECTECASGTHSMKNGSSTPDDCICNPGLIAHNGIPCSNCMPGKYKDEMNDTECKSCFTGKYSATNGATTENVCQQCPLNSNSTSGSIRGTDCKCNPGSNGQDGGPCDLCISGKFKVESGNETCTSCEIGKISQNVGGITDHVCQQCPPNSNSSYVGSQRQDCKCNPGFTGQDGGPCELCMPGKFNIAPGSDSCIDCMQGKYSQKFGGIAEHICQKCPSNSDSTISSTIQPDCKCNPGLTGQDGGPCSECAPGKYKVQHGNSTCTPCPIGTYYDNVGAKLEKDCKQCPSLSTSLHSSQKIEDCKCNS